MKLQNVCCGPCVTANLQIDFTREQVGTKFRVGIFSFLRKPEQITRYPSLLFLVLYVLFHMQYMVPPFQLRCKASNALIIVMTSYCE